jgi:hypothetical protein
MGFFSNLFGADKSHQLTIHNHGHRCYTEGLSAHEKSLVVMMAKNLDSDKYFIFNNITLPSSHTITSQIDHVIVSQFGIFVIESKDYSGWIFANENRKKWTACYKGGRKYHFQNPIFQNFAHISALKEQLPFLQKSFFSVIVFSEFCKFKTGRIPNVIHDHELINHIKSKERIWLREEEVTMTIGKLLMLCQTHNVSKESHIKNLQSVHKADDLLSTIPKPPLSPELETKSA